MILKIHLCQSGFPFLIAAQGEEDEQASIFTGEEELFAFARVKSR